MLTSANPPSQPSILLHVELRTTNSKNKWTRTDQQATNTQVTTIPDTMEKHQRWLEHTKNSFIYTQNIFTPHLAYTKYRNSVDNAPRKNGSRVQFKNWSMEEITSSVQPLLGWFLKERRLKSNVQYWGFTQSKLQMSNTMGSQGSCGFRSVSRQICSRRSSWNRLISANYVIKNWTLSFMGLSRGI